MKETFPCVVCDRILHRVMDDFEGQPYEGIMCGTSGNYGSTVFDPMDGTRLAFNICDQCLTEKAGSFYAWRDAEPVVMHGLGRVGWHDVSRPYVQWYVGQPSDDAEMLIGEEDLDNLPDTVHLSRGITVESLKESLAIIEEENLL